MVTKPSLQVPFHSVFHHRKLEVGRCRELFQGILRLVETVYKLPFFPFRKLLA